MKIKLTATNCDLKPYIDKGLIVGGTDLQYREGWIELETLPELLSLINLVGRPVILSQEGETVELEIYDGYRE